MKKLNEELIRFLAYLLVVILINIAGLTLSFRLDLTANHLFSLSKVSRQVVKTLKEPMTVKVFFTANLPAPYNGVEQRLRDLLDSYSFQGGRFFNYQFYKVSAEEGSQTEETRKNQRLAQGYGIYPVQIQQVENDQMSFRKAYMGLVFIHGNAMDKIPSLTSANNLEYQMTTTMRKLNRKVSALLSLSNKIQLNLYLSSSLGNVAPYIGIKDIGSLSKDLKSIVHDLNLTHYGKLKLNYYDPTTMPKYAALAESNDIQFMSWPRIKDEFHAGKYVSAGKGYIGLQISLNGESEQIPLISKVQIPMLGAQYQMISSDQLKEAVANSIENLMHLNSSIGYLADHNTMKFYTPQANPYMRQQRSETGAKKFKNSLQKSYRIKNVYLSKQDIPAGLQTLIIASPKGSFSDYDLYQIDQFLMHGKSLAIFMDSLRTITMPSQNPYQPMPPQYMPINTGLEKLLKHYGITVDPAFVLDKNSYQQVVPNQGKFSIYQAPMIENKNINHKFPFLKNIRGLVMLENAPIHVSNTNVRVSTLISSSKNAWSVQGKINLDPRYIRVPADKDLKQIPLAYLLEGSFDSYFKGKPLPVRKSTATNQNKVSKKESKIASAFKNKLPFVAKGKPGKIFIIGSSKILRDNIWDDAGSSPNAVFALNIIDELNGQEGDAVLRAKNQAVKPLDPVSPQIKVLIKVINIGLLPILVILAGILAYFARLKRRKEIFARFNAKG